jgi:pimeloyl-ACP methyl ester carboxylesterase
VSTYVLIPGAGSDSWFWHRVTPLLEARGHDVVAVDLPCADPAAGLAEYKRAALEQIGDRDELVVVAQSLGGFTAPLVCAERPTELLILVNAMIPRPGETDWWTATGYRAPYEEFDPVAVFLHDVPAEVIAESAHHVFEQSDAPIEEPWPLDRWPDVPTAFVLSRDDRLFPADWMRGVVRERLGIEPVEIGGGHCPSLSRPEELVAVFERLRSEQRAERV